ncbi:phenylalanine--tRNA ligase subunit alpha [Thermoplasma sp.]|uniref:phenylalanine--tRNA ligase subunit alpha n=1 Tax=Thermoplasma sp. TaxID=1973142 RepID=UPI0025E457BA|nr:phenylalanine--tRNA ligase subunit alpha [Thermoplasma sp.]
MVMVQISEAEYKVLRAIQSMGGSAKESELSIDGLSDRDIASAISWLEVKGLIEVDRREIRTYALSAEGQRYLNKGLPELVLYERLKEKGEMTLDEVREYMPDTYRIALAQLAKFGIIPKGGKISFRDSGIEEVIERRQRYLSTLDPGDTEMLDHFRHRSGVIEEKTRIERIVRLKDASYEAIAGFNGEDLIGTLDPSIISSGSWKERNFRRYDLNSPTSSAKGSLKHPMTYLIEEIRRIFLNMGFTEMSGHFIESTLWDMDALFIPQDHPARDMQDTFYVDGENFKIDHPEISRRIKRIHEKGVDGYSGWGYKWSDSESKRLILRTHTTVNTARYLYENNIPPQAIFSVEKVFRHESVDWKHLAEFYQIEGAVYSRDVNVSTLKWILRDFYSELGFRDIRLVPSYYPYTEPSLDVIVNVNGREVELGGSGIFRPEVLKILGLKAPVMAWGMGLERLAMMYYGLTDVRDLYNTDFEFLSSFRFDTSNYIRKIMDKV